MNQLSEYEKLTIQNLCESIHNGKFSNDGMVQFIELVNSYLNLKTLTKYAKDNNMSYNGVKRFRKAIIISNVKFVIDNN